VFFSIRVHDAVHGEAIAGEADHGTGGEIAEGVAEGEIPPQSPLIEGGLGIFLPTGIAGVLTRMSFASLL